MSTGLLISLELSTKWHLKKNCIFIKTPKYPIPNLGKISLNYERKKHVTIVQMSSPAMSERGQVYSIKDGFPNLEMKLFGVWTKMKISVNTFSHGQRR